MAPKKSALPPRTTNRFDRNTQLMTKSAPFTSQSKHRFEKTVLTRHPPSNLNRRPNFARNHLLPRPSIPPTVERNGSF
ncbi:hypothetical protein CH063_03533 [Colletotrichum higginsianum]|uniref:Uncharacterized protein n=1 Tax=Colletotrichum higginsianum (strain IMI 349063) TaxID=759273 RepID=H1VY77_COLHI|nr:hypothetical protein CH63R_02385 [Colletotrichum higginsianum IMI 349063]OBR13659.1 hypothetical protein CH63R_02385 [Colletotrichum higginsianum IMI 349063]CCF45189.1 hypothetical protein CH063_03533 [Colletotrichum higginsianum]